MAMLRSIARSPLLPLVRTYPSSVPHTSVRGMSLWRLFATENKPTSDPQEGGNSTTSSSTTAASSSSSDESSTSASTSSSTPDDSATAATTELDDLQKLLAEKDEQIAEANDRALRALAEMENVRMIARRDVDNARKYAAVPLAKAMLDVADNLGMALKAVEPERTEDPLIKGLFVGVQATESELLKVFKQHGISRYGAVGDKFDPNKHQAMFEAPMSDHEPGTVISVQKLGYEMQDRVLRPAEVGVSKAP